MDLIGLLADGEVDAERQKTLQAHLSECTLCCRYQDAVLCISAGVAEEDPVPESLAANVMQAVRAQAQMKKRRGRIIAFRYGAIAAATVLVILTGVRAGLGRTDAPMSTRSVSAMPAAGAEEAPQAMEEDIKGAPFFRAAADEPMAYGAAEVPAAGNEVTFSLMAPEAATVEDAIFDAQGRCLLSGEEVRLLADELLQTTSFAEMDESKPPEPDYTMSLYENGAFMEYRLWISGGHILWREAAGEMHVSFMTPQDFLQRLG